jgi:hypothetical protein
LSDGEVPPDFAALHPGYGFVCSAGWINNAGGGFELDQTGPGISGRYVSPYLIFKDFP